MSRTYQDGLELLEKKRRDAAIKGDNLAYATYNLFLGMAPEDAMIDRYNDGIIERQKYPDEVKKLEYFIEKTLYGDFDEETIEQKNNASNLESSVASASVNSIHNTGSKDDYNKKFLAEAQTYRGCTTKNIDEVIRLMQKYYPKFRKGGSDDLTQERYRVEPIKVLRKFHHILDSYDKKYSKITTDQ